MTSEDPKALAPVCTDGHITWREFVQKADPANVGELFDELARILRPSTTQELAWLPWMDRSPAASTRTQP